MRAEREDSGVVVLRPRAKSSSSSDVGRIFSVRPAAMERYTNDNECLGVTYLGIPSA